MTRKYSRQRESIKQFLMSRTDHPTADTIYTCLREQYPNISLGTVYRNLTLLEELGEIVKISTGEGSERYDANTARHHHFICTGCGGVYDLQLDADPVLDRAANCCPGRLEAYRIYFYGVCNYCLAASEDPISEQHPANPS